MVQGPLFTATFHGQKCPVQRGVARNGKMANLPKAWHFRESKVANDGILKGKGALVTGASRGIGLSIARTLGRLGARVGICARNEGELQSAAAGLRQQGIDAFPFVADVTRPESISELARDARGSIGEIEVLVNNAGLGRFRPIQEFTEQEWDTLLDTNLKAVFLVSKEFIPQMVRRSSGLIVNISSLAGKSAFAGGSVYCASKWGLMGLTACMAEDLRDHGIRVAVICPGTVATEFSSHAGKDLSKMLQPDDVAHAVEMIVTQSPQSFISEVSVRPARKP